MRLINVQSLELEEFLGGNFPPYYILSHTWGDEEISFQEYTWLQAYKEKVAAGIIEEKPPKHRERLRAKDESLRRRSGYQKIVRFAQLVPALNSEMLDNHRRTADYIWVDTCCINKESSAELSEAINSMYQWYKEAELCIAFMADVEDTKVAPQSGFGKSRWFTRGWTLQELLAPKLVLQQTLEVYHGEAHGQAYHRGGDWNRRGLSH
ncbi:HET-domain-containing protein [Canariomyces notabilis]|uniref:HET-domain-containing protein n=1 Tax=Canariomyces notabilis TaxID=2074819 RepID=A0AAN6T8C7_9PEZI|nr:HET-domain-containing protein [Canariomyces arenarius]